ncbi:N-acetylglucosamine kinase [Microbispora sp. NPDC049125]|uniref:N-acetylglucosamine kinase n=1 Tax=Microbispora sp. NPDC049125 TaxID=3154929 RepID=UPI00346538C3
MGALFVGVDGGGTSTRCVVADETGEIVGRGRAGGANAVSVRDPSANLLAALLTALGDLDRSRVAAGVFGLAGAARAEGLAERAWHDAGLPGRPSVVADVLVAFTGATTEPDGTVLVSGTGAMAAQIRNRRVVQRADGLGWLLGDEGSGVWLGRHAVTAALKAVDGRAATTTLTARIAGAVLGGPAESRADGHAVAPALVAAVYSRIADSGPAWLATLAPLVDAAAAEGDPVAAGIVQEAARRLCHTARVVQERCGADARAASEAGEESGNGTGDGTGDGATGARGRAGAGEGEREGEGPGGGSPDGRGAGNGFPDGLVTRGGSPDIGSSASGSSDGGSSDGGHGLPDAAAGPLVLAGSLLTEPTELARLVRARLGEGVAWVPARDGAAGAAALALREALPPGDPRAVKGHRALIGDGEGDP